MATSSRAVRRQQEAAQRDAPDSEALGGRAGAYRACPCRRGPPLPGTGERRACGIRARGCGLRRRLVLKWVGRPYGMPTAVRSSTESKMKRSGSPSTATQIDSSSDVTSVRTTSTSSPTPRTANRIVRSGACSSAGVVASADVQHERVPLPEMWRRSGPARPCPCVVVPWNPRPSSSPVSRSSRAPPATPIKRRVGTDNPANQGFSVRDAAESLARNLARRRQHPRPARRFRHESIRPG